MNKTDRITCKEFLLHKTDALQLCVIRDSGWIVETVWIDYEDIFRVSEKTRNQIVKGSEYGELTIRDKDGAKIKVPCLYIDI
jgi:hypothetical protein